MNWTLQRKKKKNDLNLTFFDSAKLINKNHWKEVLADENIYLSLEYLHGLEEALSNSIQFRYILFYNEKAKPVAAAVVQILDFEDKGNKQYEMFCKLSTAITNKLINSSNTKVMLCGNAFSCGENGFVHTKDIEPEEAYKNLTKALYRLQQSEKANGEIPYILLKEFWSQSFEESDVLREDDFREFKIDVNMVVPIHQGWKTMDDYLQSMVTKFRTKAKSAYKKSSSIVVKQLSEGEIEENKNEIEKLYTSVVDNADYRFGSLNGAAFLNFKKYLKDDFVLTGYFLNDKMVGFSSAFIFDGIVDANYVGFNYKLNHEYALYQRMLYDFVELAIERNATELRLGRTAEEIKSSVGAMPMDMKLYLKLKNTVSNKLLKPLIESIAPSDFELRQPFKAEFIKA